MLVDCELSMTNAAEDLAFPASCPSLECVEALAPLIEDCHASIESFYAGSHFYTVRAPRWRLSALGIFHSNSSFYGVFVWA
jgi:hypothetical protein